MEMAVESMEMALGAIPRPGSVSEHRLLSPKISLRWRRRCGTLSVKMPIDLGFLHQRLYTGGGAMSEGTRVAHTTWWRSQGWTHTILWCGQTLSLLRVSFGLRLVLEKIGTSGFVSSNSENICCVTFLKHKNSKK
jgi:hypothetical protein